jgi:hypothetical protein
MFSALKSVICLCLLAAIAGCTSSRPARKTTPAAEETNSLSVPAQPSLPAADTVRVLPPRPRPPADAADNMASNILAWDAVWKEYRARQGETNASFTFGLTNVSPEQVTIYDTSTTCDCSVAQLPASPWVLPPNGAGQIHATVDLRGRIGAVTNYVIVFTSKGNRLLTTKATLPEP